MVKMSLELTEETHLKLLEIQLDRKRKKIEPTAINKIASELIEKAVNEETPTK